MVKIASRWVCDPCAEKYERLKDEEQQQEDPSLVLAASAMQIDDGGVLLKHWGGFPDVWDEEFLE